MSAPGAFHFESFIDRFRAVARRTPDAVAVEDAVGRGVAYAALESRAAAMGEDLRRRGLGRGDVVAIELGRSVDFLAAVLGCWWSGCAYVPVDPSLPLERRRLLVAQAGASHVVRAAPDAAPQHEPLALAADDLAYVLFTSGSTGRPKGVAVEHRGLVNLLDAQIAAFGLRPGARSLFLLSTSFDASVSDFGCALLSGATLCLPADDALSTLAALERELRERRITHVDLPPALLRRLDPATPFPALETLVVGGEPSPPEVLRAWARAFRVVNVYGPTEATVCASLCVVDARWDRPLLGEPLPNVTFEVVDDELWIGGVGLARGYVGEEELTRARFVHRDGRRFYRTGDRVRRHAEGAHEFLGRLDRQLKVRGRLVAPEEIEAALLAIPGVAQAAVLLRSEGLVAFAAPHKNPDTISAALHQRLPAWLAPQRIVLLDELPRTPSDKPDLAALAVLPLPRSHAPEPPGDDEERALVAIWSRVLGVPEIGVTDDFLALGGDSLSALEVAALAEASGIALDARALLEDRTIRAIVRLRSPGARTADELREIAAIDEPLRARLDHAVTRGPAPIDPPRSILLTGATGTLGRRLLPELLQRTTARITCLVRAGDDASAAARLGVEDPRVEAIAGDVSLPQLGLEAVRYDALAHGIDTVHHCAAEVNVVKPLSALRSANIEGVREVVRFLCAGRPKRLHAASTLSVFVSTDRSTGTLLESDTLGETRLVHGGYAQSKWAAEMLLRNTSGRAGPVAHYRFGLLTGDSTTGECGPHDFLALFVRGLATLGCVPGDGLERYGVDVTPIDFAAGALAQLSLLPPADGATFHLANTRAATLAELVEALKSAEIPLEPCTAKEFRERVLRAGGGTAQAATFLALCRALDGPGTFDRHRPIDLFQSTGVVFDRRAALAGLEGSGVACPPVSAELLGRYVKRALARTTSGGTPR